jgi:hypothetical protein
MFLITAALSGTSAHERAVVRLKARLPMPSRPINETIASRARVVASTDDHAAAVEDLSGPSCAGGPPSAFELDRMLTLDEVAKFRGLSKDSIRRHYGHLIRHLSPRRRGMNVRDALTIGNSH